MKRILVTGAGGFIGHHLVKTLKAQGNTVMGVDLKNPEFEETAADYFDIVDLRKADDAAAIIRAAKPDEIYNLAADMGGIGYITANLASIARNNTMININMLDAAVAYGVKKFLFSSSACVYNQDLQRDANVTPLKEEDAYPALPERGYGWEKLYAEELCQYYQKDYGLDCRIVRFHNVYGPLGTFDGGKEKSPAALCRKIAIAKKRGQDTIEVWGDGKQTRSYMYVDDCVEGLIRLMASSYSKPLNLGTDELWTIDELADEIAQIADMSIYLKHDTTKPQGVRGRNSDNRLLNKILGWEPSIMLKRGLVPTYEWIEKQVFKGAY